MTTEDQLAVVDGLLTRPFPSAEEQAVPAEGVWEGYRRSGPGYHMCYLQASRDFWDDRSEDVVEAAEEEIAAAFESLASALTSRWGRPEKVDLVSYLEGEIEEVEPMGSVCQLTDRMFVWHPGQGRWVALAVGQPDREFPIVLLAAVGETSLL
ncbi:hypothetical protein [Nonomuraea sp. NPDC005650]|uniref:hypothetical protein n=1 Tax=Nonomuraea sp. NPDC005650 TaxID=3157045 RepID=UPI0033A86027